MFLYIAASWYKGSTTNGGFDSFILKIGCTKSYTSLVSLSISRKIDARSCAHLCNFTNNI